MEALVLVLVLALLNGVWCDYAATDPGNFTLLNYTGQVLGVEESCLGSGQAGTTDYDCTAVFSCNSPPCDCPPLPRSRTSALPALLQ